MSFTPYECCLKCEYYKPSPIMPGDWICGNDESENYAEYKQDYDCCEDFQLNRKLKEKMQKKKEQNNV